MFTARYEINLEIEFRLRALLSRFQRNKLQSIATGSACLFYQASFRQTLFKKRVKTLQFAGSEISYLSHVLFLTRKQSSTWEIVVNCDSLFWRRVNKVRIEKHSRSQWPSGPRRGSAATRLLGLRVRIPPWAWMFVCCVCCVGRGLCDGLITRPEESYRLYCVLVCDLETSRMRRLKPASGL